MCQVVVDVVVVLYVCPLAYSVMLVKCCVIREVLLFRFVDVFVRCLVCIVGFLVGERA